jgi:hypothetical protein
MTSASNSANQTRRGRPFEPGNRASRGRKAGSRNRASIALDRLAEGEAKDIARKLIEKAKDGDLRAAELVLARVWPVRKGRPVALPLPAIESVQDVLKALGLVATAVGAGELTPEEGASVAAVLEIKRKAIETTEIEARLAKLERECTG